uniref:Ribosomal protein S4 n=1 Tax=Zygnema circumcarinatum TaxID=35869 RepID=A0A6N0GXM7_ZYGCR|nr:ribosomal protein S4 [Zygnema circumcarinatum]QKQ14712.1 ribosomal protein S4 [Zygnema circumcarinatum]WEL36356.1 ribosomal protein S4 [Zygnema circumcarinatum]
MVSSKFKVSRRIVENIWTHKKLTPKQNTILRKCKQKSNRKQSDFAKQLQQRTKLSMFYGNLPRNQIKQNQSTSQLDKQKSLLLNLESRLDVLLVRIHFCSTLFAARQFIVHGKIYVNFQKVNIPSFCVSNGDILSISPDYLECMKCIVRENLAQHKILPTKPSHLEVNYKTLNAVLLYDPCRIQFDYQIELDLF